MKKLLTLLSLCASAYVTAGVESTPAPAEPAKSAAPANRLEVAVADRPKITEPAAKKSSSGVMLRCWQFGRLILEEPVNAVAAPAASQPVLLESRPSSTPIQLIDAQAAFCVVK